MSRENISKLYSYLTTYLKCCQKFLTRFLLSAKKKMLLEVMYVVVVEASLGRNPSFTWRSIVTSKVMLRRVFGGS